MELKITSLEDLKEYARGQIVELPAFADGQPFVARLKRPSMIDIISSGALPNSLLSRATSLFMSGANSIGEEDYEALKGFGSILDCLCESSFVEPTYEQIKECGIELTDDQKMFMFNYSQTGVKALESFRNE